MANWNACRFKKENIFKGVITYTFPTPGLYKNQQDMCREYYGIKPLIFPQRILHLHILSTFQTPIHKRHLVCIQKCFAHTVEPVFMTTSEIGTTWELRTASYPVPRPIQYASTTKFRPPPNSGQFFSPLGVPDSQVPQ